MTDLKTRTGSGLGRWLWPLLILALVGALGVAAKLIEDVAEGDTFGFDAAILLALRDPANPAVPVGPVWLRQSAIDITALGGFTVLWLLGGATIAFLGIIGRRVEASCLAVSVIGASLLNAGLKSIFHRTRPDIVPHLTEVSNSSFPSGHAMVSAAIYLTVGITLASTQASLAVRAYLMVVTVVLVLLIGCSRVYLGVHWPSDVLAGWSLGAAWALVVFSAERLLRRRFAEPERPAAS